MSLQQNKKLVRNYFSSEQNQFLLYLVSHLNRNYDEKQQWKNIAQAFNSQFPTSTKNIKLIKTHYDNVLNPYLNRTPVSGLEEQVLTRYLLEYGCQFRKIGKLMNRTENSVKNHFNLHLMKSLSHEKIQQIKRNNDNRGKKKNIELLIHFNTIKQIKNMNIPRMLEKKILSKLFR
jgi:hypothetical protein